MRLATIAALGGLVALSVAVAADELGWPREIQEGEARILVYEPQLESWDGRNVRARSAIGVTAKPLTDRTFGAVWFEGKIDVDRDERSAVVTEMRVARVRFPDSSPEVEGKIGEVIGGAMAGWTSELSYDWLVTAIANLEQDKATAEGIRNDPPRIVFEKRPAMLLSYDGEPVWREVEQTGIERIVNTPAVVLRESKKGRVYLFGGEGWYEADGPLGPWSAGAQPPKAIVELAAKARQQSETVEAAPAEKPEKVEAAAPPVVVVATEPTELIVFDGEPKYVPLPAGDLVYVENSTTPVVVEGKSHFVLLSGRWYRSTGFEGPWEFVRSDQLPAAFSGIPSDSAMAEVRPHVAGTPESDEAIADASVPQTAAVKRSEAKLEVEYDGEPKFEPVPETGLTYAVNTPSKVIRSGNKYYACDNAIWFVSSSAFGPWVVADKIPEDVRRIPPESPVHNVKYVQIYDATPDVVYVGYTPGYLGVYPYYGSVVWGTGWYYRPWIGTWYYPPHWTWGFHAHYNPWYGWNFGFGMGWSWGWGSISIGFGNGWGWGHYPPYHGGWWGPGGYYPPYRPGYPGFRPPPGYRPPHYRPPHARPYDRPAYATRPQNLYARPENRDRVASTRDIKPRPTTRPAVRPSGRPNDVLVDRDGTAYRPTKDGGWEQWSNSKWQKVPGQPGGATRPAPRPSTPQTRPAPPPNAPQTRPAPPPTRPAAPPSTPQARPAPRPAAPPAVQRDWQTRQRATQRGQSAPKSPRPAPPAGGASRGRR